MQGKHPTLPASGPPPTARPHPPASPELKSTTASSTTLAVHAVDAHFLQRLRAALVACLDRKLQAELQLAAANAAYEDAHALLRAAMEAAQAAEAGEAPLVWK